MPTAMTLADAPASRVLIEGVSLCATRMVVARRTPVARPLAAKAGGSVSGSEAGSTAFGEALGLSGGERHSERERRGR